MAELGPLFRAQLAQAVNDAALAGRDLVADNFVVAMLVTGAFVLWEIGIHILESIGDDDDYDDGNDDGWRTVHRDSYDEDDEFWSSDYRPEGPIR